MIKGKYSIYIDGNLAKESENIITTQGINLIKKYLTGAVAEWAGAIAIGAMNSSSPTLSDSTLEYEYSRSKIILKSYDTSTGEIVLKSNFDPTLAGKIFELGVFSYSNNPFSNGFDDKVLINFDEYWYTTSTSSAVSMFNNSRVGSNNYLIQSSASSSIYNNTNIDITGYSNSDSLEFLYNVTTIQAGTRSASVIFSDNQIPTAATASFTMSLDTSSSGVKKLSTLIGSLTKQPTFNNVISKITLVFEGGSKTSIIQADALKIRDIALSDDNLCLVSRALIGVTGGTTSTDYFTKTAGSEMDIEYRMTIS